MCAGLEDESALHSIFWIKTHVFTDVNFLEGFLAHLFWQQAATFIFLFLH